MEVTLSSYLDKCRTCYCGIEEENKFLPINKVDETRFLYLFSMEVREILKQLHN